MAVCCFFFFNDTATTEIYTLSLHDALPILPDGSLGTFARQNLDMVTGVVALDEEAGDLAVFVAGPDHRDVREGGVADPLLLPVQDVAAVLLDRGRLQRTGIAPSVGLGEAEAAYLLATAHQWQPLLFLLLRAEVVDRCHREAALDVQKSRHRSRTPGQLRYREAVCHVIPPGAAVLLTESAAHDAEFAQSGQELERELSPVPVLGRLRDDLAIDERAYIVPNRLLFLGEEAANVDEIDRDRKSVV